MDSAMKEKEMEGTPPKKRPRTVEDVYNDFKARRAGLIKPLSSDVEMFFELCDPEKDHLCLYGLPNETWEVKLAMEEVPPELPEPTLGINFVRDGMKKRDWLSMIAVHSDSWLLAVAFCFAARFGFGKDERKKLFQMINELPTIFEVVTQSAKEGQSEDDDEVDGILCGACGSKYDPDEFWICCDVCEIWFRGKCVRITPAKAESLKEFKCPGCTSKTAQA